MEFRDEEEERTRFRFRFQQIPSSSRPNTFDFNGCPIPLILTHRLPLIPLISPFTHQIPLILLFKIPKSHGMLSDFLCLILCIFVVTEYVYIERMHIVINKECIS
jgi:hypothetical protein